MSAIRPAARAAAASSAIASGPTTIRASGAWATLATWWTSGAGTPMTSSAGGILTLTLSTRTWNSSSVNSWSRTGRFHSPTTRSSSATDSGTSRRSSTSWREIWIRSSCSGSLNGCLIEIRGTTGFCAIRFSSVPYCSSRLAAVLSPTPRIPGMLSLVLPTSARKSGIFSGGTPIFLMTSSRVYVFWWSASIIARGRRPSADVLSALKIRPPSRARGPLDQCRDHVIGFDPGTMGPAHLLQPIGVKNSIRTCSSSGGACAWARGPVHLRAKRLHAALVTRTTDEIRRARTSSRRISMRVNT